MNHNGQQQQPDPDYTGAVHYSLHQSAKGLQEIRRLLEASLLEVSAGGSIMDRDLENWPVAGLRRRVLSNRRVSGTDSFTVTATPTLVVDALPGRMGGSIVNSGSNSCTLYLVGPSHLTVITAGNPAIFLAGSGGSWDFRLGNLLWSGPVSVIAGAGGNSTLTVVQV